MAQTAHGHGLKCIKTINSSCGGGKGKRICWLVGFLLRRYSASTLLPTKEEVHLFSDDETAQATRAQLLDKLSS